jgi:hypothetical protein
MRTGVRRRFWVELGGAAVTGALFVVTVVWRDWIEVLTGAEPDRHSGTLEWLVVMLAGVLTIGLSIGAAVEWRRERADVPVGEASR